MPHLSATASRKGVRLCRRGFPILSTLHAIVVIPILFLGVFAMEQVVRAECFIVALGIFAFPSHNIVIAYAFCEEVAAGGLNIYYEVRPIDLDVRQIESD